MINTNRPDWQILISGSIAGMCSVVLTHPIEVVKVRIQMTGELQKNASRTPLLKKSWEIISQEGRVGLYSGLSAALLRQMVYTGIRFGLYGKISSLLAPKGRITLFERVIISILTGGLAALITNPLDLVLVRMQADGRLPESLKR